MIAVGDKVTGNWGGMPIKGVVDQVWEAKGKTWARVHLKGSSASVPVPVSMLTKVAPSKPRKKHIPM